MKADPFPLVILLLFFVTVAGFACLFPLAHTFGQNTANTPRAATDGESSGLQHSLPTRRAIAILSANSRFSYPS